MQGVIFKPLPIFVAILNYFHVFEFPFNNRPPSPLWTITCDHLISKCDTPMCYFTEVASAAWDDIQKKKKNDVDELFSESENFLEQG